MQACIDCKPETLDNILSDNNISKSKEIVVGYKFRSGTVLWTVKKIEGERAQCNYKACSCSAKWFKLVDIP